MTRTHDIIHVIRSAATVTELARVWDGFAPIRPELSLHDRIMVMENAMTRFLRVEAGHEGDGR